MEVSGIHSPHFHSVAQHNAATMDSGTTTWSQPATASRVIDRPNHRVRPQNRGRERGGRGRAVGIGCTAHAQVATGSEIPGNPEEQCPVGPYETTPTPTPAANDLVTPQVTANAPASGEAPRSEVSVKQVQNDVTSVRTERGTMVGKVNDYKMRFHNMDI